MFRFTIQDLLVTTLYCAVALGTIMVSYRYFGVPIWGALACGWFIPCVAVGTLAGKYRGTLIGAGVGFVLGLLTLGAVWIYGPPSL
jgi:hypothetical protein